ncbi:HNH endonuclease [Sorangium sp. So ce1014]|uniref:HNH endonuclease n=1 Tax=Sorangium sp. So ce1014 TaxID=3133326 RepID=UPI003F5FD2BE
MDRCIFCDKSLTPGSLEHVFLAALGGRVATRRATCGICNNGFAADDKIDDSLAESFIIARCGLLIWTGRGGPPPTIRGAGILENGPKYDLAPGFVPVVRAAQIPPTGTVTGPTTIPVKDEEDAKRVIDILRSRGEPVKVVGAQRVQQKAPWTNLNMSISGPVAFRSVAKTALTAACVLYGNSVVRERADATLRMATRWGTPNIGSFAGWDYVNEWPRNVTLLGHRAGVATAVSGFEHSVLICDVGNDWVAYIEFFGHFRLSVWLGSASGLPAKGMAINPRVGAESRMIANSEPPSAYFRRQLSSFNEEHAKILAGVKEGMTEVMRTATTEAQEAWFASLADDLTRRVAEATSESVADAALREWSERLTAIHLGGRWEEALDTKIIDEEVGANSTQQGIAPDGAARRG